MAGRLLASLPASGSFNQVQTLRPAGWLRESSGFSRQADRSDNASQKNRDLFAAHSIQNPRTLTFKFCLFISHPLLGFCPSQTRYFLQTGGSGQTDGFLLYKGNGNQQITLGLKYYGREGSLTLRLTFIRCCLIVCDCLVSASVS